MYVAAVAATILLIAALPGRPAAAAAPHPGVVHGSTKAGSLTGAARLADEGKDHYLLFPLRCVGLAAVDANAWAHPDVVGAMLAVARDLRAAHPDAPRVPVGELSAELGGKLAHHLSHQNGLDADVFFLRRNTTTASSSIKTSDALAAAELPQCTYGPSYEVRDPASGRWGVSPDFDRELAWALASRFAARPDVQVIFVGTLLKRELARWARASGIPARERSRTLAKLYPVFCRMPKGVEMDSYRHNWCPHDDHLHVRFRCPKDSPECR